MTTKDPKQASKLTLPEAVVLSLACLIVLRGLIDHGLTTTEAGLVLGLLGLIGADRLDRKRRDD